MPEVKNPYEESIREMAAAEKLTDVLAIFHATVLAGLNTLTTSQAEIITRLDRIEKQGKETKR